MRWTVCCVLLHVHNAEADTRKVEVKRKTRVECALNTFKPRKIIKSMFLFFQLFLSESVRLQNCFKNCAKFLWTDSALLIVYSTAGQSRKGETDWLTVDSVYGKLMKATGDDWGFNYQLTKNHFVDFVESVELTPCWHHCRSNWFNHEKNWFN